MNLYKVVIDKKDTIVSSGVSSFPTFDLINLGGVGELLENISLSSTSVPDGDTEDLFNTIDLILQNWNDNEEIEKHKKELEALYRELEQSIKNDIINKINEERSFLLVEENRMKLYRDSIDDLQFTIQKKILNYSVLDRSERQCRPLSDTINIEDIAQQTRQWRKNLRTQSNHLALRQNEYIKFISAKEIAQVINDTNNIDLKEADKNLKAAFIKTIANADTLIESIKSTKVASWIKELIYKKNSGSYNYTSLPLQLKEDQTTVNIQILPKKEEYDLQSYQTEISFPIRKKVFTGIGMSFYYAGFSNNESYSIQSMVSDNESMSYNIVDEKNAKGELGLTSLLHFGYRPFYDWCDKGDRIAFNLVVGPALSLTNPIKPRIAVGGGIAIGRRNMLTINALCLAGYIEKKSEQHNVNTGITVKPENITVAKLDGSAAYSLGYIYKF